MRTGYDPNKERRKFILVDAGEGEGEGRAFVKFTFYCDFSAIFFYKFFDEEESKS